MSVLEIPQHAGDQLWLGGVDLPARGYQIAQIAKDAQGPVVCICQRSDELEQLSEELSVFLQNVEIYRLPDWETLPYDQFSPNQDIVSDRLLTLSSLPLVKHGVILLTVTAAMQYLAPRSYIGAEVLKIETGQQLSMAGLEQRLAASGYRRVDTVWEHGEFAVRGSIVDLYPMGAAKPVRIEFFDDEVETLRWFDPENQRTIKPADSISLLPGHEFPTDEQAISRFRQQFRLAFDVNVNHCPIYQDISEGIMTPGIEAWLPLFFEPNSLETIFDYLPENTVITSFAGLEAQVDQQWQEVNQRYESLRHDITRPLLAPQDLYQRKELFFSALKGLPRIHLSSAEHPNNKGHHNLGLLKGGEYPIDHTDEQPLRALEAHLLQSEQRTLFIAESPGRREALIDWLQKIRITPKTIEHFDEFATATTATAIMVAPIEFGFSIPELDIELIGEGQLFGGNQVAQRKRRKRGQDATDMFIKNLGELKEGDLVVHSDHGIGQYQGLVTLDVGGEQNEFLLLTYNNDDKLYVPVSSLQLISRYAGGDTEHLPLSRLGSDKWTTAKRKAAEKIRDTAAELLGVYALREAREGHQYPYPGEDYRRFAAGFPFEETEDQAQAINAVLQDMMKAQPMDRLVCGDVGFGKTEVAMRAAFMAAHGGKQVAVLVPTTLLAQQHYENFRDRFADWPINIEVLSRFRTGKQTDAVIESLAAGKTDIIVATHKLLSKDIRFKDLGLLIIDEEHRFGVAQKEKIKALRTQVDILTMTATPIPRTLNMAMHSIRDLSIIATPPARRLSVKTFVRRFDESLIKEALLRELLRGGQVYFLHNEVKTINRMAETIQKLVPEARIGIGHGQMSERELERVMSDFHHKRFNVLVCTTIIETGIDIPSANTIVINRADKFGLAQLHQLRGRVGRSHHQAYAWLLTPEEKTTLTKDAEKRLDAIAATQDLGAGFNLASHDLEIRGAGELLGEEQSGQMEAIGFTLYMEMLEKAVAAMRAGITPDFDEQSSHTEVNLRLPALIPDDYMPDVATRLNFYKRIASAADDDDIKSLQVELIDRFGLLPEPLKNLFRQTRLRMQCEALKINRIDFGPDGGTFDFDSKTLVDPYHLVMLVQSKPSNYQLRGERLIVHRSTDNAVKRFELVEGLMAQFKTREDVA
ncbi:transcription-repair coupling factor [Salinibius halmophilus]|uniref:transcription-repair coupling factor n=1 Tax=Salinibius halmophilus TaxID=1853216 RepID=UPI000E6637DC|nr:transcription-repair coupling factor [Salinibius halmophilus]